MSKKKKTINEFNTWGVTSKAPVYKISLAPNYVTNADAKLKQDYFYQKAEENETMYEKLRLVADLDKMKPYIERVFMDLTNMRNMLEKAIDDIVATNEQKRTMKDIQKTIDKFNVTLYSDIVPKLDELAMEEGAFAKFQEEKI